MDWKTVLRGIGGGAKGVLDVRRAEDEQQHDKDVIRMRARLDNMYAARRDRAQRKHEKELTDINQRHRVILQDREQEIADRVTAYGSNEIGLDIEKGVRSNNPVGLMMTSLKLKLMGKISQQEELDENDMKVLKTFSPQAQMMFSKEIAIGAKSRQEMKLNEDITRSIMEHRTMLNQELQSQIDFRNSGGMTPQQRMQIKAGIQGKINSVLESPVVQQIETRLAGLDAKQRAAYLQKFSEENPAQYLAYRGALGEVEMLQDWDATLNASDPNFIEELMRQLLEKNKQEEHTAEQAPPAKKGLVSTTVSKMKDVYGDMIPESVINTAKDIVQRTPVGATAKELLKTKPEGADMSRYDIAVLAKKRNIDPKKVMSYGQFTTKRKDKTLKAGALVAIQGRLWKLVRLQPDPKFEEVE